MADAMKAHSTYRGTLPSEAVHSGWFTRLLLVVWCAGVLTTLYVTLMGLPLRFAELLETSLDTSSAGVLSHIDHQLHPREGAVLLSLGLTIADYAAYVILLELVITGIFIVPSVLIVWQRSDEWLAMVIALALLCFGVTQPAIDSALVTLQPAWDLPLEMMQAFALTVAFALGFLFFPDGRFTPAWTRYSFIIAIILMTLWVIFPDLPYNPVNGESWERTPLESTLFNTFLLSFGVLAQVQRYRHYATPLQRQQIKAGALGFVMLFIAEVVRALSYVMPVGPEGPGALTLAVHILRYPLFIFLVLFLPLGFAVAILRYRLWNFDLTVRRTLLYALLTGSAFVVYLLIIILSSAAFDQLAGFGEVWFTAITALAAALVLLPAYRFAQQRIERAADRRWLDYQTALSSFGRSVRTRLQIDEIAHALVEHAFDSMLCETTVLALVDGAEEFRLIAVHGAGIEAEMAVTQIRQAADRLRRGEIVAEAEEKAIRLLVPLVGRRAEQPELMGVLLCGPRRSGRSYEREEVALLAGLADQAASAILVAEAVETQRRIEQHRNTPLGQAELLAAGCADQRMGQPAILSLFERAVTDPLAAQQLAHLPAVLRSRQQPVLELLAEGCHLLVNGRKEIDDVGIGLQRIQHYLNETTLDAAELRGNQAILSFFQRGLICADLEQLASALASSVQPGVSYSPYFEALSTWIDAFDSLRSALDKYQRSRSTDDRLRYLVDAVSHCTEVQTEALAMETPTNLVVTPMLARWNHILVESLRAERARIAVALRPITSRIVAHRPTQLVIEAHNDGLHNVAHFTIVMQTSQSVQSALPSVQIGSLAQGEAAQLHFPVRLAESGPVSIPFRYQFTDPDGQAVNHTVVLPFDVLGNGQPFRTIPNPYVTGAPLRAESPLFVGRSHEMAFLEAALVKERETTVVLTGPKRMGKTSLLFRLAASLGEPFAPVYIDMQGIGYGDGLNNLLYDIAGEISRASGLGDPPQGLGNGDGTTLFTQSFLPQLRAALGKRRLLLIFDEFEELEERVKSGRLNEGVFSYFRHLIQHEAQVTWVFAGTHRLMELPSPHWLNLFSGALHCRIGLLEAANARRLIEEPVASFLQYDDLAVDKMLRLTGGHPYFLQVLCHAVVLDANRRRSAVVTAEEVDAASTQALEMSEAHLLSLWRELTEAERPIAEAIAHHDPRTDAATVDVLASLLPAIPRQMLATLLDGLSRRRVLAVDGRGGYHFVLELQRQWVMRGLHR
ncbi:MAG: hypothetical protein KF893_24890 [Caldilineaceae bacterium]|nr:hypothetical protein [Caldilineaceae bacterium]